MTKAQKSLVSMLVMLALAGGIGAYGYFGVFKANEAEEKKKEEDAKAFTFDKAKVKKLVLTAQGATTSAEKQGDGWMLTSPVQTRGDKFALDAIVDKLADLKSKEKLADDASNAAEFGLDQPPFRVLAGLEDGKELILDVGDESPMDQSRPYKRSGDTAIYLADSSLKYPLDKTLFDLRDKALVLFEEKDVTALEVKTAAAGWSAEREGEAWKLLAPISDAADKTAVEGVLSKLRSARAKAFAEETAPADLKPYGLDAPAVTVVFGIGADKARKTLAIGSAQKDGASKSYAHFTDGGPVWEVETTLAADLDKKLEDLRDKTVSKFDRELVRKVEVGGSDGEAFAFTRKKEKDPGASFETEKFALVGRDEKLKSWKLSSLLYSLSNLRAASIAEPRPGGPAAFGLDKPRYTFSVFGDGDALLARLHIGAENGGRYFVQKEGVDRVFELEKSVVDEYAKRAEDVIDTPPPAAPATPEKAPEGGAN